MLSLEIRLESIIHISSSQPLKIEPIASKIGSDLLCHRCVVKHLSLSWLAMLPLALIRSIYRILLIAIGGVWLPFNSKLNGMVAHLPIAAIGQCCMHIFFFLSLSLSLFLSLLKVIVSATISEILLVKWWVVWHQFECNPAMQMVS